MFAYGSDTDRRFHELLIYWTTPIKVLYMNLSEKHIKLDNRY